VHTIVETERLPIVLADSVPRLSAKTVSPSRRTDPALRRALAWPMTRLIGGAAPFFEIDRGVVPGPRVYPIGALISQTGGHGDFAQGYDVPFTIGWMTGRQWPSA